MNNLNEMFPHIAGYKKAKEEGAQIVDILTNSKYYLDRGAHIPNGWLFYGNPGMGKTRLVNDIAEYVSYPVIEISSSSAIKNDETIEQNIVNGFSRAVESKKAIVFIDEIDKIAGYRKYEYEVVDNLKLQKVFLHEFDEMKKYDGIVVIATANKLDYLTEAFLRSGRFDKMVMFPHPDHDDRKEIIEFFLGDYTLAEDTDIEEVVKMTALSSCADIETMINEAKIKAIKNREQSIKNEYFVEALNTIKFKDIPRDNIKDLKQCKYLAYHESGHAIVSYVLKPELISNLSIIPQGKSAGALITYGDDDIVKTKSDLETRVKISIAGLLCATLMIGEATTGSESDLKKAVNLVKGMCDDGLYGLEYLSIYQPESDGFDDNVTPGTFKEKKYKLISSIIESFKTEVECILNDNKDKIEKLANELVLKKNLSRKEVISILDDVA